MLFIDKMLHASRPSILKGFKELSRILDLPGPQCVQVATVIKLTAPINYDHVQYPTRRKLKPMDKRPIPPPFIGVSPLQTRQPHLTKGPEEHHNRIIYGEYAVQAMEGGRLHSGHLEGIRMLILRGIDEKTMFAHWRIPAPWLAVSSKGLGKKMGQGKGPIDRFEVPIKAGRIIVEVGGEIELEEVQAVLRRITNIMPVKSRIVTRTSLAEEEERVKKREGSNQNPFSFEYCAKNNFLGIDKWLSPYDYKWWGKYHKK